MALTFPIVVVFGGEQVRFTEITGAGLVRGATRPGRLLLTRGLIGRDSSFRAWLTMAGADRPIGRDLVVSQLDEARRPVRTWRVAKAVPAKFQGLDLNASGNDVAIESLELTHEGVSVA